MPHYTKMSQVSRYGGSCGQRTARYPLPAFKL